MSTPEVVTSPVAHLLAFDDFADALGRRLACPVDGWAPNDLLADGPGWDSLRVLEVLTWLDELGVELPDDLVPELRTLGDLHHYVVTIGTRGDTRAHRPRQPLVGARVRLVPLGPQHQAEAMALYTAGDRFTRYRLRGVTPSPEGFHQMLWERVLAQFVAIADQRVLALVSAFEADLRNRHAHIAAVTRPDAPPGIGAEATALLVEHLFAEFDLRKVYAQVMAPNLAAFASGTGRVFEVEGRLVDHEYHEGSYQDMLITSVTRARWEAQVDALLGPPA